MYETTLLMGEREKIWAYSVEFCTKTGRRGFGPKAVVFQPLLESLTMPSSGSFQSLWKAGHCDVGSLPRGSRPGPRLRLHLAPSWCQSPDQDLEGSWGPAPSPACVHHLSDLFSTGSANGSQHASYLFSRAGPCPLLFPLSWTHPPRNPCGQLPRSHPDLCPLSPSLQGPPSPSVLSVLPAPLIWFIFLLVTHQHLLSHIHTPF